jgi:plastocyanin
MKSKITFFSTVIITTMLLFIISGSMLTPIARAQNNKSFYVFTEEIEGLNETKLRIPGDVYYPNILVANKGDLVTIHFYNLDADAPHTFTIGLPYNINKDVLPLQNVTFTFKAGNEGVYRFYCTYHQPTMTGQLIVLPSPK